MRLVGVLERWRLSSICDTSGCTVSQSEGFRRHIVAPSLSPPARGVRLRLLGVYVAFSLGVMYLC